ncbi:diguanylate cyclase [uncultured Psychromonas sp.]|uniref:sensor domain-containing diguanylate cyclase n=1 Tax=uncultured Psychromonas sp. TaxID=173974 RepID=UPI002631699C|nr:diguanylate cyclase [uncultured Psychromonas sp.]
MSNAFPYTNNIVDSVDNGIFVVDRNFTVQLWNKFMDVHSDFTENEIVGLNFFECFDDLPRKWFERKIRNVFLLNQQSYTSWEQRPYLVKLPNGRSITGGIEYMYQNSCFTPICNDQNEVEYVCITIKDVTDNAISTIRLQEACLELERVSSIDGLTQLYNRSHWEKRFVDEIERVDRYGGQVSLIMFDMDHFKHINDQYGHLYGDEVLRQVSKRCIETLRSADIIGRYGGEEFIVFLPETNLEETALVAEKLRKKISDFPICYDSIELPISISIGFTASNGEKNNTHKMLTEADIALYKAKENGRNQCVNYVDCSSDR